MAKRITRRRLVSTTGPDFYVTPRWATAALVSHEQFKGPIRDCACGNGGLSRTLHEFGFSTWDTDLHDHGYGTPGVDFLTDPRPFGNIITNPPFKLANEFVAHGLQVSTVKLALLMQLTFLETQGRYETLFRYVEKQPTRCYVFTERLTMYPHGIRTGGGSTTAYAWFVWDKTHQQPEPVRWIEPGYRDEYGDAIIGPTHGYTIKGPRRTTLR